MTEIKKSRGTTDSEKYLAQLADRTFLNLWAYPNVYRDVVVNGQSAGKELCDLLVVCGNHVIIFSDKKVQWQEGKGTDLAWTRWYKRAIKDSALQLRGAERWIAQYPERIFLDEAREQPLPIKLPPPSVRKVHLIAVALGAGQACSEFFCGDSGSFMIRPSLMGDSHFDTTSQTHSPFTIGDVEPNGSFIHVMDDVTLDILMKELDTVTDFTDYLERKTKFIRSGNLIQAAGEEELLAFYLTHTGPDGRHDFVHPTNRPMSPDDKVAFDQGFYAGMLTNPQYIEKKKADQNSYIWDNLIEAFTDHMLAGTTLTPDGTAFEIGRHEVGVRHMALESRLARRVLGENILKILNNRTKNRNFGCTLPPVNTTDGLAYGFMTLAHPKTKLAGGYEQYRRVRSTMLQTYCFGILKQYPHIRRIIAVATEPIPGPDDPPDTSEDMITVEQPIWTPEMEANLEHDLKNFGILQQGRINPSFQSVTEYPEK